MYSLIGLIVVAFANSCVAEGGRDYCPAGVSGDQLFVVGDTCYNFRDTQTWTVSYGASEDDCKSRGGLLLTLGDKTTADAVEAELSNRVDSHTILLGLRKINGEWRWATGDALTFNKFPQQSSPATHDCAKLKLMAHSSWEKIPCTEADWFSIYVCEHNARAMDKTNGGRRNGNCLESLVAVLVSVVLVFFLH